MWQNTGLWITGALSPRSNFVALPDSEIELRPDATTAFFSYARVDSEFALRLAKDLKGAGAEVWIDKLDIEPGQEYDVAIEEALNSCERILVILSPASVKSTNVRNEISRALRKGKHVIPVIYQACDIPLNLERNQYIDFQSSYETGLKVLLGGLDVRALGRGAAASASAQIDPGTAVPQSGNFGSPKPDGGDADKALLRDALVTEQRNVRLRRMRAFAAHSDFINGIVVTSDGQRAISVSGDKTLKIWDLASERQLAVLTGHTRAVSAVSLFARGERAISASDDNSLKVWDLLGCKELATLTGHKRQVRAAAVVPDAQRAISASDDQELKIWDLAAAKELCPLMGHIGPVYDVGLTPNGQHAISGSGDNTLRVWDLAGERQLLTLKGHEDWILAVAVTPDGRQAVSACCDGSLKVWDLRIWRELRTLTGHSGAVVAVAASPDRRFAVSASSDQTVKVWNLDTGLELASLNFDTPVRCCSVCADGNTILAGDSAGMIHRLVLE